MKPRKKQAERSAETSRKILDAAQKLFARKGYEGVSMRDIAAEGGVNLASIVYYFDSKAGLYEAVVTRYSDAINKARRDALIEADKNPSIEGYVRSFIDPPFRIMTDATMGGPMHALLLWRAPHEPRHLWDKIYSSVYDPVNDEYIKRIRALCPKTTEKDFSWCCHMMTSVFFSTLGKCANEASWSLDIWLEDADYIMDRLVHSMSTILRELSGER